MVRTRPDKAAAQTGPPTEIRQPGVCGRLQREHRTSEYSEYEIECGHRSDFFRRLAVVSKNLFDGNRQIAHAFACGVVHRIGNGGGD